MDRAVSTARHLDRTIYTNRCIAGSILPSGIVTGVSQYLRFDDESAVSWRQLFRLGCNCCSAVLFPQSFHRKRGVAYFFRCNSIPRLPVFLSLWRIIGNRTSAAEADQFSKLI